MVGCVGSETNDRLEIRIPKEQRQTIVSLKGVPCEPDTYKHESCFDSTTCDGSDAERTDTTRDFSKEEQVLMYDSHL
jgi:hypothetical protein